MRVLLTALLAAAAGFGLPAAAMADGLGPPGSTIYAFDQQYRTVATPTALPNVGQFDTIYTFPDCPTCARPHPDPATTTAVAGASSRPAASRPS
jgi:hypothetical protein